MMGQPNSGGSYVPVGYADTGDYMDGLWRSEEPSLALQNLSTFSSNAHSRAAKEMRKVFTDYFVNEGSVPWLGAL